MSWTASVSRVKASEAAAKLRAAFNATAQSQAARDQFECSIVNIDSKVAATQPDPNGLVNVFVSGNPLQVTKVPEPI